MRNEHRGPATWEDVGLPLEPFKVVTYELAEPFYPNKANMSWEVWAIVVYMVGPDTYEFFDKCGTCLNPFAPYWADLPPTEQEIRAFLLELE
jgi:hypothetical protein